MVKIKRKSLKKWEISEKKCHEKWQTSEKKVSKL